MLQTSIEYRIDNNWPVETGYYYSIHTQLGTADSREKSPLFPEKESNDDWVGSKEASSCLNPQATAAALEIPWLTNFPFKYGNIIISSNPSFFHTVSRTNNVNKMLHASTVYHMRLMGYVDN